MDALETEIALLLAGEHVCTGLEKSTRGGNAEHECGEREVSKTDVILEDVALDFARAVDHMELLDNQACWRSRSCQGDGWGGRRGTWRRCA